MPIQANRRYDHPSTITTLHDHPNPIITSLEHLNTHATPLDHPNTATTPSSPRAVVGITGFGRLLKLSNLLMQDKDDSEELTKEEEEQVPLHCSPRLEKCVH